MPPTPTPPRSPHPQAPPWPRRVWSICARLAWPLLSLAAVMWSLWLLQMRLEAEVSSDPVVRAMLDEGAFCA